MSAVAEAVLKSAHGEAVPLKAVSARGRLDGLLFELTVEQQYHNSATQPVEAVFTFPLPVQAQLLGFDLEIGARRLTAVAAPRQEASQRYEQAIDAGDAAALLEQDCDGLYTVSLGSLLAGESAVIRYRYAQLLEAHEGSVRIEVPTVIAPRYGNPADAALTGPAIPGTNLLVQYPFSITLELPGIHDAGAVRSPTHRIETVRTQQGISATLSGALDRDFVLEIASAALPLGCLIARDGEEWVALASTALAVDPSEARPLALKVLLDCSGSMQGSSIAAAKRALRSILDRLHGDDRIALTRFGSTVEHVSGGLEPADAHTIPALKARVQRIDADMGGTEMARALRETGRIRAPRGAQADIVLITDGEIFGIAEVVEQAKLSGQRLFTIAIGAAPVEALARKLAQKTGGGCEFVAPGEDAEGAILRTFKRLRATARTVAAVHWPEPPVWVAPLPESVFPGDTLHLMAGFRSRPASAVSVTIQDARGGTQVLRQAVSGTDVSGDRLPRLAAGRRLAQLPEEEARALAVRHQLVSPYTSLVVVAERAAHEKAQGLPIVVPVPHMAVPDLGSDHAVVHACLASRAFADPALPDELGDLDGLGDESFLLAEPPAPFAEPAAASARPSTPPPALLSSEEARAVIAILEKKVQGGEALPVGLDELNGLGVAGLETTLAMIAEDTLEPEETVIRVFLALLVQALGASPELTAAVPLEVLAERRYRLLRQLISRAVGPLAGPAAGTGG